MAGISVQFVGISEVLKAFDNMEVVNWSVCQGKALNFSYSGTSEEESRNELETWLKMIGKRTNQAIYVLKFYDPVKGQRITASTPEHTSFNFRLYDEDYEGERVSRYPARIAGSELFEEIRSLKDEIKTLKERPAVVNGTGEEPLELWEKVLDHPLTLGLIGKVFNLDLSGVINAGKIAGVPEGTDLDSILDKLEKYDPDLISHLFKLSEIAEKNPANFKMLLSMLDKF